ncbi:hypothetical protein STEG23_008210 [Scotinomys teguina]
MRSEYTIGIRQIHTPNPINYTEKREHSSMLALLTELSQNRSGDSCRPFGGSQSGPAFSSVFQKENFQLQLTPPPVAED